MGKRKGIWRYVISARVRKAFISVSVKWEGKEKIYELFEGSHWNMHKMGSGKDAGERM